MARVKKAVNARKKHKKVLKLAKGYFGAKSKQFRAANQAVMKVAVLRLCGTQAQKEGLPENCGSPGSTRRPGRMD